MFTNQRLGTRELASVLRAMPLLELTRSAVERSDNDARLRAEYVKGLDASFSDICATESS
jgi:hypothetical protein